MGSIDLDIVGARIDQASTLASLINGVAKLFIERGVPPPNTPFKTANGSSLVWVSWESARYISANLGGPDERDADHRRQRGILLAPSLALPGGFERGRPSGLPARSLLH